MKKMMITTILFLMIFSITAFAGTYTRQNTSGKCLAGGCNAARYNGSFYCSKHKCVIYDCKSRRGSDGMYCSTHHNQYYQDMVNHYKRADRRGSNGRSVSRNNRSSSGSSSNRSNRRSGSSRNSSFDPDDHDIEGYYEDNRDEYDDYDDAYDGFLDDEDAWEDY